MFRKVQSFRLTLVNLYINYCKIKLNLNSGGARRWHGNGKWVTLRRWGDVHAGGESCERAGEGATFPKSPPPQLVSTTSASAVKIKFNFTIIDLQMY